MANLDVLFNREGLTREALDIPAEDKILGIISNDPDLQDQWECLATGIGVAEDVVHDINETTTENKCLALMRRWKQLYGSGATYLKLIEGFEYQAVGRRDLTETVIKYVLNIMMKEHDTSVTFCQRHRSVIRSLLLLAMMLAFMVVIAASGQVMYTVISDTLHREDFH